MPRLRVEFVQILSDVINDLAGAARPVEIKMFGPDLNALEAYAQEARAEAVEGRRPRGLLQRRERAERGAGHDDQPGGGESRRAHAGAGRRRSRAARCSAQPAGEIRLDDRSVGVRVRAPDSVRFDPRLLGVDPDLLAADATRPCRSARSPRSSRRRRAPSCCARISSR